MPGTYNYAIGPWLWDSAEFGGRGAYVAPPGSVCVLDYRNDEQMGQPNRTDGCGLFAFSGAVQDGLAPLGTGYAPELLLTPTARQEMQIRLGLGGLPIGDTLAQAAVSCFADYGDPSGVSFARPLDIDAGGFMDLWLMGHSRVHREWIDHRELLTANPKGRANRLRDLLRRKLDIADESGKLSESLGAALLRCGYSADEVRGGAKGRKAEWQQLVSPAVKAKHGGALAPKPPRTAYTELWPTNASDLTGSAQTLTWTELATDGFADGLKVASGTVRATSAFTNRLGICSSAVSSADHVVAGVITGVVGGGACFVCCRQSASRATFYAFGFYYSGERRLYKVVNGAATQLATGSFTSFPANVTCDATASTITGTWPTLADQSVTDTAIVGNLLGSVWIYLDAPVETYGMVGQWSIDDRLTPPVAAFSGTPLSGLAPLSVAFTDASTNTPTSWLWERSSDGGGNWATFSTSQNPTAEFTAGTWAVRLTATNAGGSDAETKLAYVIVTAAGGAKRMLTLGVG